MTARSKGKVGVGGRQEDGLRAQAGGGYLGVCTGKKSRKPKKKSKKIDSSLGDLSQLPEPWRSVAAYLGRDQWMVVWAILSASDKLDGRRFVQLPSMARLQSGHRDEMISALVGKDRAEIRAVITAAYGDTWSESTIRDAISRIENLI